MFLQTQLTQDLSVFLLCLVVLWLVVGPPTASRRNGPSVPRVSLPGPAGVLRCPRKMASEAERQPSFVLVGVAVRVNVSWWSKQGQRDCTLQLLHVLLESFAFHVC